MSDRYAVIGNPIAHSRSPSIHAQFAAQTGQDIVYERILAEPGDFVAAVDRFRGEGGAGMNVTVPFKLDAFAYATRHSRRAQAAGAVNTLDFRGGDVFGDNTDGIGLVRDVEGRAGLALAGASVLLAGAGGAARGVVRPLLDAGISRLAIANRTAAKALQLAADAGDARVAGGGFESVGDDAFDLVVNATSTGLSGDASPVPSRLLRGAALAYEMVYGANDTAFMRAARAAGVAKVSDGLGMLVEQAAESFLLWRGVRPHTDPVYARLRLEIDRG